MNIKNPKLLLKTLYKTMSKKLFVPFVFKILVSEQCFTKELIAPVRSIPTQLIATNHFYALGDVDENKRVVKILPVFI